MFLLPEMISSRVSKFHFVCLLFVQFIYRWDLECCPIFDKLKTLSLNEWFTTIDLLCILQHSPVLEVLTLQLGSTEKFVRATGAEEKIEQSFVCSHLKVVNIECRKVDEGVHKILKFLSTCGILRDQISITHTVSVSRSLCVPCLGLPQNQASPWHRLGCDTCSLVMVVWSLMSLWICL